MADKEMPHAQQLRQRRVRQLAERCIERMNELGVRGKRRDDATLDYFIGAAVLAEIIGDEPLSKHLASISALIISIHGFAGLQRLLQDEKPT